MYAWIIIDGNNLVHSDRDCLFGDHAAAFDAARFGLARVLDELVGELAGKITVVFDGTTGGKDEVFQNPELQVVFSPADMTADSVIERMVSKAQDPGGILVVSSDRGERYTVGAAGALTMSCQNFIDLIKECRQTLSRQLVRRAKRPTPGQSLGEFFPGHGSTFRVPG